MAIKFTNRRYWNPTEWVSRTLFRAINKIPSETLKNNELQILQQVQKQIKLYVWLINCENYNAAKFEYLKGLILRSREYETISKKYKQTYRIQLNKLIAELDEIIKMKSS